MNARRPSAGRASQPWSSDGGANIAKGFKIGPALLAAFLYLLCRIEPVVDNLRLTRRIVSRQVPATLRLDARMRLLR
jgi:hypothetical protein